jgi:hypothetical protein
MVGNLSSRGDCQIWARVTRRMWMIWLICGLLLALSGGLAVVTRWGDRRPVGDDTLVTELLGPPPAWRPRPAPPVREDAAPPPVPVAEPAGEDGWLDTQLAWITAWSQGMSEQIAAAAAGHGTAAAAGRGTAAAAGHGTAGEPVRGDTGPPAAAGPASVGRRTGHGSGPSRPAPAPRRCIATTVKGNRCKLPAEPARMTCAIHAKRAHP